MVNGFSKCQSSCFIDLASQRGEQTHLDGISPTARTAQRVRKPNYPEMWSWLCAFVIHNVLPHPISRRSFPHQLDTSQLLSASPVLSDLSVSARPRVFPFDLIPLFLSFPFISFIPTCAFIEWEIPNLRGSSE